MAPPKHKNGILQIFPVSCSNPKSDENVKYCSVDHYSTDIAKPAGTIDPEKFSNNFYVIDKQTLKIRGCMARLRNCISDE